MFDHFDYNGTYEATISFLTEEETLEHDLKDELRRLSALENEKIYTEVGLENLQKMKSLRVDARRNMKKREGTVVAQEFVKLNAEINLLQQKIASHETYISQVGNVINGVKGSIEIRQKKLDALEKGKTQCGKVLEIKRKN